MKWPGRKNLQLNLAAISKKILLQFDILIRIINFADPNKGSFILIKQKRTGYETGHSSK
jgi:hypothetical protein